MCEFPDDVYKVDLGNFICYITVDEAMRIEAQIYSGTQLLEFTDIVGSRTLLPLKDFHGMWHTNSKMRELGSKHDEIIKAEFKKEWE